MNVNGFLWAALAAGAAAALAIKDGKAVQDVDYKALYARLTADGLPTIPAAGVPK